MRTISESITTTYIEDYDVAVVGGGVAGVAAALAAARRGANCRSHSYISSVV